jgi:hypothetical protein
MSLPVAVSPRSMQTDGIVPVPQQGSCTAPVKVSTSSS